MYSNGKIVPGKRDARSGYEARLDCHGTKINVTGTKTKNTLYGELEFPVLDGRSNQDVGRVNPDESLGSCTSCHTRHEFSIETARKPYTCAEVPKFPLE